MSRDARDMARRQREEKLRADICAAVAMVVGDILDCYAETLQELEPEEEAETPQELAEEFDWDMRW